MLPQVTLRHTSLLDESPQRSAASSRFFRVGRVRLMVDLLRDNMEENKSVGNARALLLVTMASSCYRRTRCWANTTHT